MIKRVAITFITLCMMAVVYITGVSLSKPVTTPLGILDLEFATNYSRALEIYNAWNVSGLLHTAKVNTYWDFLFLTCYGCFFFVMCRWLGTTNTFKTKYTIFFAKLGLLTALLDAVENILMLEVLQGTIISWHVFVMTIVSIIKWTMAFACLAFILLGSIQYLYKRALSKAEN